MVGWAINSLFPSEKFNEKYKKKKLQNPELIGRIERAITRLKESKNPESLGVKKKGELQEFLSYRINRSSRILYQVKRENGMVKIYLIRVCNHKQAYGKD